MKKLEDIPKKQVFNIPEGYFETLPEKIQARITGTRRQHVVYRYRLQYVLAAVVLFAAGVFWFAEMNNAKDADAILASVQTEALVAYLNDTDITTEDLLETLELDARDVEGIETKVYALDPGEETLDELLDDYDMENI